MAIRWSPSNVVDWRWTGEAAFAAEGSGINDAGDVVGDWWYGLVSAYRRISSQKRVVDLPSLSGDPHACTDLRTTVCTQALAVNGTGLVVGVSQTPDAAHAHAVVWTAANQVQDLGTLVGGAESRANDVNAYNQVAGWSGKSG